MGSHFPHRPGRPAMAFNMEQTRAYRAAEMPLIILGGGDLTRQPAAKQTVLLKNDKL